MSKLQARVERIEKKLPSGQDRIEAIFIRIVGAENGNPVELPVLGWRYDRDGESVDVMRLDGEYDQELEERAMALARQDVPQNHYVVRLIHIHE